ncbi:unnamed protein product [Effrenium voratum]|nr:unnamed protein product [Effrenium voratum]
MATTPFAAGAPNEFRAIGVPLQPAAYGARSISTRGYPRTYERPASPGLRWASPVRMRGPPMRAFSPARQASPLQVHMVQGVSRGIVFPGAAPAANPAAARPPLPPEPFKAVPVEEWQRRKHFTRAVSPARSPMRQPVTQGFVRVSSPQRVSPWAQVVARPAPIPMATHVFKPRESERREETQELRWQPPQLPAPSEPLPLKEGQSVTVGKMQLQVREAIGSGAYAQVWAATTEDGREVAVKEMRCGVGAGILPDASVQRAVHEVKVMRLLTEACEGELRVPKLLQHQFWDLSPAEPGAYVLRVAMLRRQGRAVIDFLQEREMSAELAAMGYCSSFLSAAGAARELLHQLSPTFAKLNRIAMHRDVNARNILVSCLDPPEALVTPSKLEFTLLDFGSSVDFHTWSSGVGEGSWMVENPTGDARYWGPASWLRFLQGPQALQGGLQKQYSHGLDAFALAICSLEVLSKLHLGVFPQVRMDDPKAGLLESIEHFQNAWSRYWNFAVTCFSRLAEYSQLVCLGDQKAAELWQDEAAPQRRRRAGPHS